VNQGNQPEPGESASPNVGIVEIPLESESIVEGDDSLSLNQSSLKPKEIPRFDIVESQERTRSNLAYGLLGVLVLTLAGIGIFVTFAPEGEKTENHRELLTLIWTSEVTLVGSALGFYFGSQTRPR
jgi:hypothetical protein